jgi:hypothetical protein
VLAVQHGAKFPSAMLNAANRLEVPVADIVVERRSGIPASSATLLRAGQDVAASGAAAGPYGRTLAAQRFDDGERWPEARRTRLMVGRLQVTAATRRPRAKPVAAVPLTPADSRLGRDLRLARRARRASRFFYGNNACAFVQFTALVDLSGIEPARGAVAVRGCENRIDILAEGPEIVIRPAWPRQR